MNRVRRLCEEVLEGHRSEFGGDFADNKKALQQVSVIRSKKLRNCMAGLITRMVRRELRRQKETEEQERSQAARAKSAARETLVILDADVLHGPVLDHVSGRPVALADPSAGAGRRITIPDTVCEELEVWMAAHSDLRDRVPPSELRSILSAIFEGRKGLFTRLRPGAAHLKKAEDMHRSALDDAESEQAGRWLELKSMSGQDKDQDLERPVRGRRGRQGPACGGHEAVRILARDDSLGRRQPAGLRAARLGGDGRDALYRRRRAVLQNPRARTRGAAGR